MANYDFEKIYPRCPTHFYRYHLGIEFQRSKGKSSGNRCIKF